MCLAERTKVLFLFILCHKSSIVFLKIRNIFRRHFLFVHLLRSHRVLIKYESLIVKRTSLGLQIKKLVSIIFLKNWFLSL
jgi:hypothetical protein